MHLSLTCANIRRLALTGSSRPVPGNASFQGWTVASFRVLNDRCNFSVDLSATDCVVRCPAGSNIIVRFSHSFPPLREAGTIALVNSWFAALRQAVLVCLHDPQRHVPPVVHSVVRPRGTDEQENHFSQGLHDLRQEEDRRLQHEHASGVQRESVELYERLFF